MFLVGMYVSCPIQKSGNIVNILGKITKYVDDTDEATVVFYDCGEKNLFLRVINKNKKTYFGNELRRADINTPITAFWKERKVNVLFEMSSDKDALKSYCIKYTESGTTYIRGVDESDLIVDFYQLKNSAFNEATEFINSDSELFLTRSLLSKRKQYIESFESILSTLVNTRINLYPHQIETVIRATREGSTRVMLADEVGLGKTIEALVILKFYLQKNSKFRTLIIVPSSLEYQWLNETNERFGIEAESFSYNKYIYHKKMASTIVISYADYHRYKYELDDMHWDMLIIDETHKVLNTRYYISMMHASRTIKNVVLLSATPITHDGVEYLYLMRILNPTRYGKMSEDAFRDLVQLQGVVMEKLSDMNDTLEFYDQIDMTDTCIMNLQELNEKLKDAYLNLIIKSISPESSDKGLYMVKLALEYLRKKYVIESCVIRHRKNDIEEAKIKRELECVKTYYMEGADLGINESNLYDALLSLISRKINNDNKFKWIRVLEAMHSSPYALSDEYAQIELPVGEKRECYELIKKWEDYCDKEIKQLIKGHNRGNTRFGKLIEIIETYKEKKILIFTEFKETAKRVFGMINKLYGKNCSVLFDSDMSRLETQLAAKKFQNDDNCRYIVCDKSGGEGRNFQKADIVVHFDMSWSPAMMEQRIGRLDRIGRDTDRDVQSIVIYASETIEETIFSIYNDTLKVFSRSLCGLEIVFEKLQEIIADSFARDTMYGLSHAREEIEEQVRDMENAVEKEIYLTSSNETNAKERAYITEVSEAFEREQENKTESSIITLLNYLGIQTKIIDDKGAVYVNCKKAQQNQLQMNLLYEINDLGEYEGTFRRQYAVKHDLIDYFSPNHILYQTTMKIVDQLQKGRFHAVSVTNEKIRWAGFVFIWNVDTNSERLYRGKLNPQRHQYIKRYLAEQQISTAIKIYGEAELNESEVMSMYIDGEKRIIENVEDTVGYGVLYDEDSWKYFLNELLMEAESSAKRLAQSWLKNDELKDYLIRERIVKDIKNKTINNQNPKMDDTEQIIMSGLHDCKLQIDSIMYVEI